MSVRTQAVVWEYSKHSGPHLLMMLAIADFSDDDGQAFPAVATLAKKCRMTPRNAQLLLASLRDSGELEIAIGEGPKGTNLMRIRFDLLKSKGMKKPSGGVKPASGVKGPSGGVKPASRGGEIFGSPLYKGNHQEPVEARTARQHSPRGAPSTPRGTRLPEGWQLPEDWREWCAKHRPDLDPQATAEAFSDYWHAKPGKDASKLDWFATWRNWCRNQRQRPGSFPTTLGSGCAGRVLSSDHVFTLGGDE